MKEAGYEYSSIRGYGERRWRATLPRMRVLGLGERGLRQGQRYWLITESRPFRTELTLLEGEGGAAEGRTLAVFSFPEEAREFLEAQTPGETTHRRCIREVPPGELLSMMSSPLHRVERIALDPPPELAPYCAIPSEMVERRVDSAELSRKAVLELVTLTRAQFVDLALEKLYREPEQTAAVPKGETIV